MTVTGEAGPPCPGVLNLLGEHFWCDWPTDADGTHTGWSHASKAAQAVWDGPPTGREVTARDFPPAGNST